MSYDIQDSLTKTLLKGLQDPPNPKFNSLVNVYYIMEISYVQWHILKCRRRKKRLVTSYFLTMLYSAIHKQPPLPPSQYLIGLNRSANLMINKSKSGITCKFLWCPYIFLLMIFISIPPKKHVGILTLKRK